jgi:hypothetical protein
MTRLHRRFQLEYRASPHALLLRPSGRPGWSDAPAASSISDVLFCRQPSERFPSSAPQAPLPGRALIIFAAAADVCVPPLGQWVRRAMAKLAADAPQ